MKVVITDHPFVSMNIAQEIFSSNGIEMEDLQTQDSTTIIAKAKESDAILVGMAKIDEKIIGSLNQCKLIVRFGTGYDNVDVKAATSRGIPVSNVPDFCMDEVSDHAMAFILAAGRKIIQGQEAVKEGKWGPMSVDINSFYRLRGQTLGLYGFGRISLMVAQKARAFGMNCISFDPLVGEGAMSKNNVEKVEMEALLKRSDFISLHAPLTDETENAFDLDKFSSMKKTAWIINTSRGPIIREKDLATALDQGLIAGAALDVLASEPPDKDSPLLNRDNVFITPHIAWMSLGARDDMQRKGVEEVVRVLKGEMPKNIVNSEVL